MPTTRPENEEASGLPTQSDAYQPLGRQQAPTNADALYGGNADDNSGSGANARPTEGDQPATQQPAPDNPGASGGPGVSGTSIGQVNL